MKYDIIIIGSGPAGYVAAIRAAQLGLRIALIEKDKIGGMCLNWGCIPSKSIIESAKLYNRILNDASKFGVDGINKSEISFNFGKAVKRANIIVKKLTKGVEFLLKKNKVDLFLGEGEIISENRVSVNNEVIETENIIISTGSFIPEIGLKHKEIIVEVRDIFKDREIPNNIVVYGNDSTAMEFAQFFSLIGKNVTLIAHENCIMPLADEYLSKYMLSVFSKSKIKVIIDIEMEEIQNSYKNGKLIIKGEEIECDFILNAQARNAVIPKSNISFELENGFIKTDSDCLTSVANIYAVGDVNGKSRYAHISSAQGLHVVNKINGVNKKLDTTKYPLNMYTVPEIAQIGYTESQLKEMDIEYKISEFSLIANGKAMAEGSTEGFVRVLSEKKYGEVIGVQMAATHATDLIAEAAAFMQVESTVYDIANTVHAHPTISEIFMEAGFEAVDQAIHK